MLVPIMIEREKNTVFKFILMIWARSYSTVGHVKQVALKQWTLYVFLQCRIHMFEATLGA